MKLKSNNNLVIKENDKAGACVITNSDFYKLKIASILKDTETYKKLPKNIDTTALKRITDLTNKHREELTEKEIKYLTNSYHKTSQLYGLPKIHKSKIINSKIIETNFEFIEENDPTDLNCRPIIAGPNCVTSNLSTFLDIILKEYINNIKSYIRDDIDFVGKIKRTVNRSDILVTFDVISIYTNIDNTLGIQAISYWLNKFPEKLPRNNSKEFIIDALNLVVQNNTFTFDEDHYLQIRGTAMGTKVAPTYATMVMGYLETKLCHQIKEKYGNEITTSFIDGWHSYLDDCFNIWNALVDSTENLLELLQKLHPSIQFTKDERQQEINFLDIKLIIRNNQIITDQYRKPADSQLYVYFNSCHLSHTKRNIPFNLARLACTIIEYESSKSQKLDKLHSQPNSSSLP